MIQGVYDFFSTEVKKICDLFFSVQRNVDNLLSTVKDLLQDVRAFNVKYKAELGKKDVSDTAHFKGFENSLSSFQEQLSKVVLRQLRKLVQWLKTKARAKN